MFLSDMTNSGTGLGGNKVRECVFEAEAYNRNQVLNGLWSHMKWPTFKYWKSYERNSSQYRKPRFCGTGSLTSSMYNQDHVIPVLTWAELISVLSIMTVTTACYDIYECFNDTVCSIALPWLISDEQNTRSNHADAGHWKRNGQKET